MFSSLHDFMQYLGHINELHTIDLPVSTRLELAAITRRISGYPKASPALFLPVPMASPFRWRPICSVPAAECAWLWDLTACMT